MAILHYSSTKSCPKCGGVNLATLLKAKPTNRILARKFFLSMIEKQTPILSKKIAAWMKKEGKRIAAELSKKAGAKKVNLCVLLGKVNSDNLDVVDSLDLSNWDELAGIITDDTFEIFRKAYEDGLNVAGVTDVASTQQMDDAALKWAQERSAELVGKVMDAEGGLIDNPDAEWNISETTRNGLRSIIADAVESGASVDDIASDIEDSFMFSDTRATTIARTELATAHVQGNKQGWKESGSVDRKQSVLGSEHDLDDECDDAASDGPIGIDELFSNGMDAPPYHPNCVCDLLPVLADDSSDDMENMLKGDVTGHEFHGNQWKDGGGKLSPEDKARLTALRVPPAWTDVKLSSDPKAGLQVIGKDSKGRSQYIYSKEYVAAATAEKFARISEFHNIEPKLTEKAFSDMNNKSLSTSQRDTAAALALISQTGFRVGSNANTGADTQAYGASNLLGSHVDIKGNSLRFNFTGKKGVEQDHTIQNADLAKYIAGRQKDVGKGQLFNTSDTAIRNYMHSIKGKDFNVKDYRTLIATKEALKAIHSTKAPTTQSAYAKARNAVGDKVSAILGNTRSMALNSYIHPAAFSHWGFTPSAAKAQTVSLRKLTQTDNSILDDFFESIHYTGDLLDWRTMPETEPEDDDVEKVQITSLQKLLTDDKAGEAHATPTEAQITAGNYRKGHLNIGGLDISIENPAGSIRNGKYELKHHYGYIRGAVGADGDHIDCFVRPKISEDYDNMIWIINQAKADGSFDEHKCMIGWSGESEAQSAYMENYSADWNRILSVVGLPFTDFKNWIRNGNHKHQLQGEVK